MKLCLTLAEGSLSALQEKVDFFDGHAQLIETRLDFLDSPGLPSLPEPRSSRYIATCRPGREGGNFQGSEEERIGMLREAVSAGYDWIDVEYDVDLPFEIPSTTRVIRSRHIFGSFPKDLSHEFQCLIGRGDVAKLAVDILSTRQLTELLSWMVNQSDDSSDRIIIGMGVLGQPSRYLGPVLGSPWTYVCEDAGMEVAPGQLSLQEAKNVHLIGEATPLYGVIGNPVAHSLSPHLHNRLLHHYECSGAYIRLPLDDLLAWFNYVERSKLNFCGYSVTLPFKKDIMEFCNRYSSPVASINTLQKEGIEWIGANTDHSAFLAPLRGKYKLEGSSAVVLGNGGVAQTVVGALKREGVTVKIAGRDPERARRFGQLFDVPWGLISDLVQSADLLVNATPVGQYPEVADSPLDASQIDYKWVYDLIYNPEKTRLLGEAEEKGCGTISGIEMFAEQGAAQFKIWTGIDPDRALVSKIIKEVLSQDVTKSI